MSSDSGADPGQGPDPRREPAAAPLLPGAGGAARRARHGRWGTWLLLLWALGATTWGVHLTLESLDLEPIEQIPPPQLADRLVLEPSDYAELPGWADDDLSAALPALERSCQVLVRRPDEQLIGEDGIAGVTADWRPLCDGVSKLLGADADGGAAAGAVRELFERELRPVKVTNNEDPVGLFTGYYEPVLRGSRRRSPRYRFPLYTAPRELISLDLGKFRNDLAGRRIAGRLVGRSFEPYPDRAAIDGGAVSGRGLELVWVDDAIAAFFLHIQGSGRVELAEGGVMRVGYAAQNGHPYYAIGRELVARGELELEEVSMQSIQAWLEAHPDEASGVMATNQSYVFFRELDGEGPMGSLGVVLTPGRSLAVDRRFLPLGVPLWLDTYTSSPDTNEPDHIVRRLFVAQDTGGAIRGPVRGDVFWGFGAEAGELAGRMRQKGRLWLLLPRTVSVGGGEQG